MRTHTHRLALAAPLLALAAAGCGDPPAARPAARSAFESSKSDITRTVAKWDSGAGVAARVADKSSGKTAVYVLATKTPPKWRDGSKAWVTVAKAVVGTTPVATVVVGVKELAPGHFEGSGSKRDCVVGWSMRDWATPKDSDAPDFAWSDNETGYCDVTLREGRSGGHLEGRLRAKLFSNDKKNTFTIDTGYVYLVR